MCGFRIYRQRFGDAGFWMVSNKQMPKNVDVVDGVYHNKTAEAGQIKQAKLVCKGAPDNVKCEWNFEIQD